MVHGRMGGGGVEWVHEWMVHYGTWKDGGVGACMDGTVRCMEGWRGGGGVGA